MTIEPLQHSEGTTDSFLMGDGQLEYYSNGEKKYIVPEGFSQQVTGNGVAWLPNSMVRVCASGHEDILSPHDLDEEATEAWTQWLTEWNITNASAQDAILSLYS
jgi:hypothetical protein